LVKIYNISHRGQGFNLLISFEAPKSKELAQIKKAANAALYYLYLLRILQKK